VVFPNWMRSSYVMEKEITTEESFLLNSLLNFEQANKKRIIAVGREYINQTIS
jgi:hypothetical protein